MLVFAAHSKCVADSLLPRCGALVPAGSCMMSYVKGHIGYLVLRNSHVLLEDVRVLLTIDRAVELTATGQLPASTREAIK